MLCGWIAGVVPLSATVAHAHGLLQQVLIVIADQML
jgi:hypothetical protein